MSSQGLPAPFGKEKATNTSKVLRLIAHPANILTPCTRRKGLRANDGAAAHERRGVTPAPAPLFVPDSDRLWKQTVRHGGLLHLQPTDGRLQTSGF